MSYQIVTQPSKSGKRMVYYPMVEGRRISRTNFARKWEARNLAEAFLKAKAA